MNRMFAEQLRLGRPALDYVEARGEGKGRSWYLSAAVYRALEAPAGYVRIRGFEPLQQEQMVLQYVEAHGQINRSQATDLCALSSEQPRSWQAFW